MTDKKLTYTCDQTGEKFKRWGGDHTGLVSIIPINPLPKLEVGDWYIVGENLYCWEDDAADTIHLKHSAIHEIRKANGTVWKK